MVALIFDLLKRRRQPQKTAKNPVEMAARPDQLQRTAPKPGLERSPASDRASTAKVQPIDSSFSKRKVASQTGFATNSLSILDIGEPAGETRPAIAKPAPIPSPVQSATLPSTVESAPIPQPEKSAPIPPVVQPATTPEPAPIASAPAPKPVEPATTPKPEPEAKTPPCTALLPPVTIDSMLWERLLAMPTPAEIRAATRRPEPTPVPSVETSFVIVSSSAEPESPAGMVDELELKRMLARMRSYTGLVISIGLNEPEDGVWRGEGLYQSITNFVSSVLGPGDYGCRTGIDEFLVVSPGKQGTAAQNHLNAIADRLWDFQLRGIGACAILFSWGGATVDGQSLSNAIASATQRMRQAKQPRHRRTVRMLGASAS